ncbi:unnamed protein product [Sphagnum jensenii]|uniref:Alcohol dehydrogenase-like N-terminal domain-containing protein n=1 Tax=Sphagnum jensenii TaxID=128206 RepID=A0ABP1C2A8_9BRYO
MSNRAVEQQNFDAKDPFAGLALVTKPVPKAEPGHVVVRITLRPVNPTDLISINSNTLRIPGSEGFGIVHEVGEGVTTVAKGQRVVPFVRRDPVWALHYSGGEIFEEYIDKVSKLIEAKIIVPLVGETYDLADFQLAIKKSTEVARGGKVFLSG